MLQESLGRETVKVKCGAGELRERMIEISRHFA